MNFHQKLSHAREPLYSKFAVVPGWLQSTSAEIGQFFFTGILKNMFVLLYVLLWEVFFTDYCHLYIQPHICLTTDMCVKR